MPGESRENAKYEGKIGATRAESGHSGMVGAAEGASGWRVFIFILKFSGRCQAVHILFTPTLFPPCQRLEIRNARREPTRKFRKFILCSSAKKILTEKLNRDRLGTSNHSACATKLTAPRAVTQLRCQRGSRDAGQPQQKCIRILHSPALGTHATSHFALLRCSVPFLLSSSFSPRPRPSTQRLPAAFITS